MNRDRILFALSAVIFSFAFLFTFSPALAQPEPDDDNDGLVNSADPCDDDARNECAGPLAFDETEQQDIRINANVSTNECTGPKTTCGGETWAGDFGYNQEPKGRSCNIGGGGEGCEILNIGDFFPGCDLDEETEDIFQCEHSDKVPDPDLVYQFDVLAGNYVVTLYFVNTYDGTTNPTERVFDIYFQDVLTYDDFDQVVAAGGSRRIVTRAAVVEVLGDEGLSFHFDRVRQAPAVKGIEVRTLGSICGNGVMEMDDGEQCDAGPANGEEGSCCTDQCQYVTAGTTCRPSADNQCDSEETCTGDSGACPDDLFADNTTVCRAGSGDVCDPDETCPGIPGEGCPPDTFEPDTTECRPAAGECDVAESCVGVAEAPCPADSFQASSVECRAAAGDCDAAEECTGADANCPDDEKRESECRASTGECDPAESCNGFDDDCPADVVTCDGNGVCDGTDQAGSAECQGGCLLCGDGNCDAGVGETCETCGADCGSCCGNGFCDVGLGETCGSCQVDCGDCCGDNVCGNCDVDCGPCCGDGFCDLGAGEDCNTCDTDCGVCPEVCGDNVCDAGENCANCEDDCCDGICDDGSEGGTPDCNGFCEPGDSAPDCDGVCDLGEAFPDCDGVCDVPGAGAITSSSGFRASGIGGGGDGDCDGVCDTPGEEGTIDCETD